MERRPCLIRLQTRGKLMTDKAARGTVVFTCIAVLSLKTGIISGSGGLGGEGE